MDAAPDCRFGKRPGHIGKERAQRWRKQRCAKASYEAYDYVALEVSGGHDFSCFSGYSYF
jgi:hypothetical protein